MANPSSEHAFAIFYFAATQDRLIISANNATIADIIGGNKVMDTSVAQGKHGYLWLDLPRVAQTYLPLVWGKISSVDQKLGRSALDQARWPLRSAMRELAQLDPMVTAG